MVKKKQASILELIDAIQKKLELIEQYMAFTITADRRFEIGQRVEWSDKARKCGMARMRNGRIPKGNVLSFNSAFLIRVKLDGRKTVSSYHHAWFNPVGGPKLF